MFSAGNQLKVENGISSIRERLRGQSEDRNQYGKKKQNKGYDLRCSGGSAAGRVLMDINTNSSTVYNADFRCVYGSWTPRGKAGNGSHCSIYTCRRPGTPRVCGFCRRPGSYNGAYRRVYSRIPGKRAFYVDSREILAEEHGEVHHSCMFGTCYMLRTGDFVVYYGIYEEHRSHRPWRSSFHVCPSLHNSRYT